MTQVQFLRLWWWFKPAQVKRRTWFFLGLRVDAIARAITLPFRRPRLWWFSRRVYWHYRYGLPMPRTDLDRGVLRV